MNLYRIQNEYLSLINSIIDNEGEITPEQEFALQITQEQLEYKGVEFGFLIKKTEGECNLIDEEIKRLTTMKKARITSIERLKQSISDAMQLFSIEEIKVATLKLNFRKSESVEIIDMSFLDERYTKTTTTVTADKIFIKSELKSGRPVNGAVLVSKNNLQIK